MEFIRISGFTHVDVEANDNTPMMAQHVYKNWSIPYPISHVRIFENNPEGDLCAITGWSSSNGGEAVAAYAVRIEDSSAGNAVLVYGGDWGLRLRPAEPDEPWDIASPNQWGETHLVLSSEEDVLRAGPD
ncbi:MAG TPA: hypothetical protein VFX19_12240 [Dehalococcoidia bacterium]|nr:hypothetical protein [Dehalococcoidia bacterium]